MAINITTNIVNTTGGNVTQITAVQGGWQTIKTAASMSALTGSAILKQNLADGQIFYISESQELYQLTIAGTVPFQTYTFNSFDWPGGGGGSTDTGSLLTTASISNNVFTFTKGDASTFDVDISPVTASLITTASVSSNTITFTKGDASTFNITVDTGSGGGGTPGGSTTQIQFNDGGSFGGSSDFTWNGSSLQIGGSNPYLRIYETSQEAVFLGDTDSGNTIAALRLYDNNQVYTQLGTREGTGTDSFIGNTLRIGDNSNASAQLHITGTSTVRPTVLVEGAAAQSANLQEWQNSAGSGLAHVDAVGNIETSGYVSASGAIFRSNSDNTSIIIGNWTSDREQSVIIGQSTIPQRAKCVTIGWHAESRNNAVAIGWNAGNGGSDDSVHIGYNCSYGADNSVLIGSNLVALSSAQSVAIGKSANVTGGFNVGIGYLAEANIESVGIGANVIAPSGSVTIGYNVSGVADRVTIQPSSVLHAGPHLLDEATPASTTNTLYNSGGNLYFNGAAVGGSVTGVASGIAFFDGSGNLTSSTNFTIDTTGNISASGDISIGGHLSATTKSFLIAHPTKDGKLQYASLEGPENGVYVRGTTNEGEIILPDYWSALVHEDSITVSLTSVGEFQPLYVESKFVDKITVGGATGNYDYVVYAERKDVPKLEVEKWE